METPKIEINTYGKTLDLFSLDANGKNNWKFKEYKYITDPTLCSNPNPFAVQAHREAGLGCCAACGHFPIVHHFFISHPTKGTVAVGSECIDKVLSASSKKALKAAVSRASREYLNQLRNLKLYNDVCKFFEENPDLKNTTTGYFEERWERNYNKCDQPRSISDNCVGLIRVKHLDDSPINSECDNCKKCMEYAPIEASVSGYEIINMVYNAYQKNHKDISYVFNKIKFFNEHKVYISFKKYEGELKTKIPEFPLRNFKKEPLTLEEQEGKEKIVEQEVNSLKIRD